MFIFDLHFSASGHTFRMKINCALMKRTELNMLWKLVKASEDRPLTAADLTLLLRIRFALQEYEAKVGQGRRRGEV
jgi:hypothetical protein